MSARTMRTAFIAPCVRAPLRTTLAMTSFTGARVTARTPLRRRTAVHAPQSLPQAPLPAQQQPRMAAAGAGDGSTGLSRALNGLTELVIVLFPLLAAAAAYAALQTPASFSLLGANQVRLALAALMLTTGLGLRGAELRTAAARPSLLLGGLIGCYVIMPLLAVIIASVFNLTGGARAGLLLLGLASGGQASNLCTNIARGDVALSVAMTAASTLLAAPLLPLLSKFLLGAAVPVDAQALAISAAAIVLAPVALGAALSRFAKPARSALPIIGIALVLVLVAGPVAATAPLVPSAFKVLAAPVALLHVVGGIIGYACSRLAGAEEKVARALAFETGFKSPALTFVLASQHFVDPAVALPSVVSIVVLAPIAALFAVIMRAFPSKDVVINATDLQLDSAAPPPVTPAVLPNLAVEWAVAGDAAAAVGGMKSVGIPPETRFRVAVRDGPTVVVHYAALAAKLAVLRRRGSEIVGVERI